MDARRNFVNLFTDAALDRSTRPSIQIVDGYWQLIIKGDNAKRFEMSRAAGVPVGCEGTLEGDTLTIRWPSIADQIFGADGLMARNLPGYESRLPQIHMGRLVQRAIEMGEPAMIEAGTGTGKSFAYAAVAMAMNKRVVISTSNKALQAQLYQKDIPFLCKLFPGKKVALAQGKSNYLCRLKCQDQASNVTIKDYTLAKWYTETETGNTEELDFQIYGLDNWTIDEECNGKRCPFYASCFYYKAKAERKEADVIICNHALLILNQLYPQAQILPPCDVVVVDEAHKLADYARGALGDEFTLDRIQKTLGIAFDLARNSENDTPTAEAESLLQMFRHEVEAYCQSGSDRQIGVKHEQTFEMGQALAAEMHAIALDIWNPEDSPEDEDSFKIQKKADKIRALADKVRAFSSPTTAGRVRWIEKDKIEIGKLINLPFDVSDFIGRMAGFTAEERSIPDRTVCARCGRTLTASMVHVLDNTAYGPDCIRHVDLLGDAELMPLSEWLAVKDETPEPHHDPTAIIFTSATIAAPDLGHFMKECGISHGFQMVVDSPFDYKSNALLYIPNGETPTPKSDGWQAYAIDEMRRLVQASKGGAFLLFTSYTNLKAAVAKLRDRFLDDGLAVYVQGELPKGEIAKRFKKDGNAVLFATKSFWEGISIEGEALRLVVIDKMPFAAPSPLLKARETTVNNAFGDLHLPEMVIDLKQGSGRLIRRMDDRGVIAILDSRARLTTWGRDKVLPSLPPARLTCNLYEVSDFYAQHQKIEVPDIDFPVALDSNVYAELAELGF